MDMDKIVTNWLESHRHANSLLGAILANTDYQTIEQFVDYTNRSRLIMEAFEAAKEGAPQNPIKEELFTELKDFLKTHGIHDLKALKTSAFSEYKSYRITKRGIEDILDYCVLHGLSETETSELLRKVAGMTEDKRLPHPSKTAFAIVVLWVQVWQDRVLTERVAQRFKDFGVHLESPAPCNFRDFNSEFEIKSLQELKP